MSSWNLINFFVVYTWFCYYIISDSIGTVHYIAQIRVIVSWKTSNVVQYNIFRLPRTMLRILCALCCRKTAVRVSQYFTLVHCVKTAKHIEKSRILLVSLVIMLSFSFTQTNSLPYQLVASWKGSKLQGNHSTVMIEFLHLSFPTFQVNIYGVSTLATDAKPRKELPFLHICVKNNTRGNCSV